MPEFVQFFLFVGFTGLMLLLRLDARRFSAAEWDTEDGDWRTWLSRLSWYAAGIGLALVHMISIPVSNTSVNPARSLATALFQGDWALGQVWAFLLFPAIGAVLAGAIWLVIDSRSTTADEGGESQPT